MSLGKKQKKTEEYTIPQPDISVQARSILLSCRIPDITEEKIRIVLEGTRLTISALKHNTTIVRKITLPENCYISKKSFRDGILEITVEREMEA